MITTRRDVQGETGFRRVRASTGGTLAAITVAASVAMASCSSSGGGDLAAGGADSSADAAGSDSSLLDGSALDSSDASDASDANDAADAADSWVEPVGAGHIYFRQPDSHWYRISAATGASPEDVSSALDAVSPGGDQGFSVSKDGAFVVSVTSRWSCASQACIGLFSGDLGEGELVQVDASPIEVGNARAAVASGGEVIAFSKPGPHALDIFVTRRVGGLWTAPLLLTGASSHAYHHDVSLDAFGTKALFDCGDDPYGNTPGTALCEVMTDGTGFRKVVDPADGPDHLATHEIHHGDYAPDGSIVFEADWNSEQVWRLPAGGGPFVSLVSLSGTNAYDDNSPCVLPDGRIASLWLNRPGNPQSFHELKVMAADGGGAEMLVTGVDIVDVGLACGN